MMDIYRPLGWFVHRCGQTTPEVEIRRSKSIRLDKYKKENRHEKTIYCYKSIGP